MSQRSAASLPPYPRTDRVDLFEYQAKQLLATHGVPIQRGEVATTPEEARAAAAEFIAADKSGVVIKAQVKAGGRGKAGGGKVAPDPLEGPAKAGQILGLDLTCPNV